MKRYIRMLGILLATSIGNFALSDAKQAPIDKFDKVKRAEWERIYLYEKSIDNELTNKKQTPRFFGAVYNDKTKKITWQEFSTEEKRSLTIRRKWPLKYTVDVYMRNSKPIFSAHTIYGQDETWIRQITYYHRPNGITSSAFSMLVNLHKSAPVYRRWFFWPNGQVLSAALEDKDDKARLPKKKERFLNNEQPPFIDCKNWPFYSSLKKPRPKP